MQWEPQLHEMNETLKPLQILNCRHENARFLSSVLLRSRFTIVKESHIQNEFVERRITSTVHNK